MSRALGFGGVPSGDAAFDARVAVTGRDARPSSPYFAQEPAIVSCEVSAKGRLVVEPEALAQVRRVRALALALGAPGAISPGPPVTPLTSGDSTPPRA